MDDWPGLGKLNVDEWIGRKRRLIESLLYYDY